MSLGFGESLLAQTHRDDRKIGVGTRDEPRPSLRTGRADFPHPALQLVGL